MNEFLRREGAKPLKPDEVSRLRRFVVWCGISTPADAVPPFRIEEFLQQQLSSSIPARTYMPVLKAFFAHAAERGVVATNPMSSVKLPRGAGGTASASRKTATGPRAAAAPARPVERVYLSRERHTAMQAELERLKTDERHRISRLLYEAIKDGDITESAAYEDAKMQQGMLEGRIRELEQKLAQVQILDESDTPQQNDVVAIGCRVILHDLVYGDEVRYLLVDSDEADPRAGKLSYRSPVGQALLGKRQGDQIAVVTPGGRARYRVVAIG